MPPSKVTVACRLVKFVFSLLLQDGTRNRFHHLHWGGRVKHLGCYFSSPSGEVDLSQSVSKFYGSFNNILNVLRHNRHEMLAVHLIKTYCLSSTVYSCEVWSSKTLGLKSLAVARNNAFRKIFNTCWRESTRSLQFYCNCLPVPYLIDQCRMLFWKKMTVSSNRLLLVLSRLCQTKINSRPIAAKYGTVEQLVIVSCTRIKWHVWVTFPCNVLWLYVGLFADECVIDCICLFPFNFYAVFWHNKE